MGADGARVGGGGADAGTGGELCGGLGGAPGGVGATDEVDLLKALRAACAASAKLGASSLPAPLAPGKGGAPGGTGGVDRIGGRGADEGGGGGALGGTRLVVEAEVSADRPEGFRDAGGGIGGFLPIGGGFGFGGVTSGAEAVDTMDDGLRLFRSAAILGGAGAAPGGGGGAPPGTRGAPGGFGAEPTGGRGTLALDVSGSDRYGEALSAPVSMPLPPVLRSFGMPPANSPPSCGAAPAASALPAPSLPAVSLLLRTRPPGTGGARPLGGFGAPAFGTGGAPTAVRAGPSDTFPTCGADRSLTAATFLSLVPCSIDERSAPCRD